MGKIPTSAQESLGGSPTATCCAQEGSGSDQDLTTPRDTQHRVADATELRGRSSAPHPTPQPRCRTAVGRAIREAPRQRGDCRGGDTGALTGRHQHLLQGQGREKQTSHHQARAGQRPDALPRNPLSPAFLATHATVGKRGKGAVSRRREACWAFPSTAAQQLSGISQRRGSSAPAVSLIFFAPVPSGHRRGFGT